MSLIAGGIGGYLGGPQIIEIVEHSFAHLFVVVDSAPSGADVSVDAKAIGKTPTVVKMSASVRQLSVRVGDDESSQSHDLRRHPLHAPDAVNAKLATTSSIEIRSTPAGATVLIDGKDRGTTPTTIDDVDNTTAVDVSLSLVGHDDVKWSLPAQRPALMKSERIMLPTEMKPFVITASRQADLFIDEQKVGRTDSPIRLPFGRHALVFHLGDEGRKVSREIVVKKGVRRYSFDLSQH